MTVYVVLDPDDENTPLAGVWTTLQEAEGHRPPQYVIIKTELDVDLIKWGVATQ